MALGPATATYFYDTYRFSWPSVGLQIVVDRLHEGRSQSGLLCELSISLMAPLATGLVREGNFNLSASATRTSWQRDLEKRVPVETYGIDWYDALEQVCTLSRRHWREGEPVLDLALVRPRLDEGYLLPPYVVTGAASGLFGDGGTGKSLILLAGAVSIATGLPLLGASPTAVGPVLFCDWEWEPEAHAERLNAICLGADIDVPAELIFYRHEVASIWEAAATIRRRVAETEAIAVLADSLGYARGGEPESAELTLRTFEVFRSLGVPVWFADHVAKHAEDRRHSFGSVYTRNSARLMWRVDAAHEEGASRLALALVNTKSNRRYHRTRGLLVDLETDEDGRLVSVRFQDTDPASLPQLRSSLGRRDQVASVLKGGALSVEDIVNTLQGEGTHLTRTNVRYVLNANRHVFVQTYEGSRRGEPLWGLLSKGSDK